jgi:RNA polymerase sigma-70 factor (ECF subfamily)
MVDEPANTESMLKQELPLEFQRGCDETTAALCVHLPGHSTSPSVAARRAEINARLAAAFEGMNSTEREVLAMRHFEQLTSAETAQIPGIQERAAAKRYLRALARLRTILSELPGGLSELRP